MVVAEEMRIDSTQKNSARGNAVALKDKVRFKNFSWRNYKNVPNIELT